MSIKIVTNLKEQIAELKNMAVKMAVSYIKKSGVDIILKEMNSTVTEVLLSGDRHMSDPSAVKKLLRSGAEIGLLYKPRFHAKIYIFTSKNDTDEKTVIIGSSNLSESGWRNNDECNVIIKEPDEIKEVESLFEKLKDKCIHWIKDKNDKIFIDWAEIFRESEKNKQINREYNEKRIIEYEKYLAKKQLVEEIKQFKNANWKMLNEKSLNYKTGFLKFQKGENEKLISVHTPDYEKYENKNKIPVTLPSKTYNEMIKLPDISWIIFVDNTLKEKYMVKFNDKNLKISRTEVLSKPSYKYHQIFIYKDRNYQKLDIQKLLE